MASGTPWVYIEVARPEGHGQEEEVSKWALCCIACATRSFKVTLEPKATGLTCMTRLRNGGAQTEENIMLPGVTKVGESKQKRP